MTNATPILQQHAPILLLLPFLSLLTLLLLWSSISVVRPGGGFGGDNTNHTNYIPIIGISMGILYRSITT